MFGRLAFVPTVRAGWCTAIDREGIARHLHCAHARPGYPQHEREARHATGEAQHAAGNPPVRE